MSKKKTPVAVTTTETFSDPLPRLIRLGYEQLIFVTVSNRRESKDEPVPQGTHQYLAASRIVALIPILPQGVDAGIHDYYPTAKTRIHIYDPSENMLTIEVEETLSDFALNYEP